MRPRPCRFSHLIDRYHAKVQRQRLNWLVDAVRSSPIEWFKSYHKIVASSDGECIQTLEGTTLLGQKVFSLKGKQAPIEFVSSDVACRKVKITAKDTVCTLLNWDGRSEGQHSLDQTLEINANGEASVPRKPQSQLIWPDGDGGNQELKEEAEKDKPPGTQIDELTEHQHLARPFEQYSDCMNVRCVVSLKLECKGKQLSDFVGKDNQVHVSLPAQHGPGESSPRFSFDGNELTGVDPMAKSIPWVFTPTYNRYNLSDPRHPPALLDRSAAIDEECVQVLVVREGQLDEYAHVAGNAYVIVALPNHICMDGVEMRNITEQTGTTFKVDAGGIGFARLFTQILSSMLGLQTVWMVDDNVQDCYAMPATFFEHWSFRTGPVECPATKAIMPEPCSFSHIIQQLSLQIENGAHNASLWGQDYDISDEAQKANCTQSISSDARVRELAAPGENGQDEVPSTRAQFSSSFDNFAIIGTHRDVGHYYKITKPFGVTASVYSFYLLNVAATVERGVFFPPKQIWEVHPYECC